MKKALVILLSSFLFFLLAPVAGAFEGGLLDKKPMTISMFERFYIQDTYKVTDGNLNTQEAISRLGSTNITYTWAQPVNLTSFKVEMNTVQTTKLQLISTDKNGNQIRKVEFVESGTYTFVSKDTIKINLALGNTGQNQEYYIKEFDVFGSKQLARPLSLNVSPDTKKLRITWDAVAGAVAYRVYADGARIAEVTGTSYDYTGLTPDQQYSIRVSAVHSGNEESEQTNPVTATAYGEPVIPVLSGTATYNQIKLNWTGVDGVTLFSLYRLPNSNYPELKDTLGGSYTASGLEENSKYTFYVTAKDKYGRIQASNTLEITTPVKPPDTEPPEKPKGFSAQMSQNVMTINLGWIPNTENDLNGYKLWVSEDGKEFKSIGEVRSNWHSYKDFKPESKYIFRLVAVDDSGNESDPVEASITVPKRSTDSQQETNRDFLLVTWTETEGATGYAIYYNNRKVGTVGPNVFEFKITRDMGYMPGGLANRSEVRAIFSDGSEGGNDPGGGSGNPGGPGGGGTGGYLDFIGVIPMIKTAIDFLLLYKLWIVLALAVVFSPALYGLLVRLVAYLQKKNWIRS